LAASTGKVLGAGFSDYNTDAIRAAIEDAGLQVSPMSEWVVSWPHTAAMRDAIADSTLYVTLEPSIERRGTAMPPITELIRQAGIPRVVIGCADPVPERRTSGAAALHAAGITVSLGSVLEEECQELIQEYSDLANSKLQRMARKHFQQFGRPLGFMHCSVIDSDNKEAFARQGNAFGTNFGGKSLSHRDFGSYELAPPPEMIWVDSEEEEELPDSIVSVDFEEEDYQGDMSGSPMMPWYEQVDAVVATFPREGNGPPDDQSVTARLNGLKWLATHGNSLPAGVERILVMDSTDLKDLPLTNDDPNLPPGVDVEAFWKAKDRKPTRVLLRRGGSEAARAAAKAAAKAAASAAEMAKEAAAAIESGDAARAAESAINFQNIAQHSAQFVQNELREALELRRKFEEKGVVLESLEGGEPIDIMNHLGKRNGYHSVVWRAGCWGERGVRAILAGAFQWVAAHLAVDAVGGKFWQLMLAENAVQAACGPRSRVKVFADQEDISLEYCDQADEDTDCVLTIDGRPVRHVRLDCRIALVDENRPREFVLAKTKKLTPKVLVEEAPWFL
jgi:pyrimidine deaminase RibD-like protein